ncbi:hypothetical protein SAMN05192545_3920 [Maribacter dokdonensis]|uniref:Uncharacterized protein n=1 Tax=Maribacter dokdonensis TaxID=320912 RepID=A0ABY0V0K9_9FLAO|nr:hypothetical protein [Maribacter dokdonensis]SDT47069.1 hypothetical protein SAMN05192545_3920 [Maribacter dokdonensis]
MNLEERIEKAQTSEELQTVINGIKKQENGFENTLRRHLENAFWYNSLIDNIEKQKDFMLKVCATYNESFKTLN